jgi:hypothetical protein
MDIPITTPEGAGVDTGAGVGAAIATHHAYPTSKLSILNVSSSSRALSILRGPSQNSREVEFPNKFRVKRVDLAW